MSNELRKVEYQSISGIQLELDADTVIKYCARGNGNITPQEVALFLRTCQAKRLDPLENGEVYLIKYDNTKPAQIVVGKHAYLRRADRNPEYRGKKSGIVIVRDGKVIQKEGCCLYKVLNETLIGGWCRVFRRRAGSDVDEEFYREVALEEYSSGQANWKVKPATMIEKVAVSQCLRDAFPNDYEGLYSEDEMLASGAIPAEYTVVEDGDAKLASTGVRAGSTLTQDAALRNLLAFTGRPLVEKLTAITENPARLIGVFDRKGSIADGKDGDLVLLDGENRVDTVFVRGRQLER